MSNKYSIAFAKAKNKCGTVVQFDDNNKVKLEYTNQYYEDATDSPKDPPFPNVGDNPPEDDYLTGQEYVELGIGKKLEDLPQCISIPVRVDVIPSIAKMELKSDGTEEDTIEFEAYVFGNNSSQTVAWETDTQIGSIESVNYEKNGLTFTKGIFKPHKGITAQNVTVRAKMLFDSTIFGEALILF